MDQVTIQYYKSKMGDLVLGSFNEKLCLLDYRYRKMRAIVDNRIKNTLKAEYIETDNAVLKRARQELDEYFAGTRKKFDIPILMVGSEFQKRVWHALLQVPYGATSSYLQIAKNINHETAVRAVANANGANAISIIIPCHRIIGSNGELVGYGGGLPVKKRLLKLEQSNSAV